MYIKRVRGGGCGSGGGEELETREASEGDEMK